MNVEGATQTLHRPTSHEPGREWAHTLAGLVGGDLHLLAYVSRVRLSNVRLVTTR